MSENNEINVNETAEAVQPEETKSAAPVLTLLPQAADKAILEKAIESLNELNDPDKAPQAPDAAEAVAQLDAALTEEELKQIETFASQIDITDPDLRDFLDNRPG